METTTAENPLNQRVDQLCNQSSTVQAVALKQIEAMSPSDPDDCPEFDVLREQFGEYHQQIQSLLGSQASVIESLIELCEVAPQAA